MRKQRKKYVTEKSGRLYFRITRTEAGKRHERYLPLPGLEDSEEFDAEYWKIRSGSSEQLVAAPRTSWEALIISYKRSHLYRSKADGTRRKYNAVLEQLREKNGTKDIRRVTRQEIRAIHEKYAETPRKADHYLQVIRILLNFAKNELDWIDTNPAMGIKVFGPQSEFQPWPQNAQKAFLNACEEMNDTIMQTAYHLGTGTGQRPGDLCLMQWKHYDGEYVEVLQEKTRAKVWIYCPQKLREHLDGLQRQGKFILAKNLTQAIGYNGIEKRFRRAREMAGKNLAGLVMHGWRYTAAIALAEAGCSDAEIQSVTGHKTTAMVLKYRRQSDQRRLSKQAQTRRGQNGNET